MKLTADKVYKNKGNIELLNLVPVGSKFILDIGCGGGDNGEHLTRQGKVVDGITLSAEEAEIAAKKMNKIFVHNLENGLPQDVVELYDVVLMSHVLEHISYPEKLLTDIRKVLKSDGKVLIAVPNIMHYKSRFKLIRGKFDYEETGIWDYTHVRWYTLDSIVKTLEKYEFKIHSVDVSGDVPAASLMRRLFSNRVLKIIYKVFKRISRELFGYQILVVVTK